MKNEMTADEANDIAMRLEEIREEIKELTDEALELVDGTIEYDRAQAYWYGHIKGALDTEEYPGGMCTMAESQAYFENDGEED